MRFKTKTLSVAFQKVNFLIINSKFSNHLNKTSVIISNNKEADLL